MVSISPGSNPTGLTTFLDVWPGKQKQLTEKKGPGSKTGRTLGGSTLTSAALPKKTRLFFGNFGIDREDQLQVSKRACLKCETAILKQMAVRFSNLPLTEVGLRFSLDKELPRASDFIVDLFSQLGDRVETLADVQPERPPGLDGPIPYSPAQEFRLFGGRALLRMQPQMIGSRWVGDNSADYVGFDVLLDNLELLFESIAKLRGEAPSVTVVNMFYVNFIELPEGTALTDFFEPACFPELWGLQRADRTEFAWTPKEASLRVAFERHAVRQHRTDGHLEAAEAWRVSCSAGIVTAESKKVLYSDYRKIACNLREDLADNFVRMLSKYAKQRFGMEH